MRTIITTVGASLLSNAAKELKRRRDELTDEELANFLRMTDPKRASAETNSLSRLLQKGDHIIFLHSDTPEGERCARLLCNYYERQDHLVKSQRIPDLNYQQSRFKLRGLRSLVAVLCDLIQQEQRSQREVLINATGGFKAEIAYATLVGLLFRIPVYYIHEQFKDIVDMPSVPVAWDYSLLADHEDFFEWLELDLRSTEEVDQRLRGLPDEVRMLLAEEEGFEFLSPAGEAFYRAFRQRIEQVKGIPIFLSKTALDQYERLTPTDKEQIDRYLKRLRLPEWRVKNSRQPANADCLVALHGRTEWRILYYGDDEIKVLEILRHDEYERRLSQGIRRDQYSDFQEWKKG